MPSAAEVTAKAKLLKRKMKAATKEVENIAKLASAALENPAGTVESEFKGAYRTLEKYYTKFEAIWDELLDLHEDVDVKEGEEAPTFPGTYYTGFLAEVRKHYAEANTAYEILAAKESQCHSSPNVSFNEPKIPNHLPPIPLPKFGGHLPSWPSYRDTYVSLIHDDTSLPIMRKYHHLISSLEGPALAVIKHIPMEEAQYRTAWAAILKAYDHKRLLGSAYLNQMLDFKPSGSKASLEYYRTFLNEISENVSAFKSLKIGAKEPDFILFHIAMRALDQKTREEFELFFSSEEFPSFNDLKKFIESRVNALQLASSTNFVLHSSSTTHSEPKKQSKPTYSKSLLSNETDQTEEATSTSQTKPSTQKCPACGQSHKLVNCVKFVSASVQDREKCLKKWKGCLNCLNEGHATVKCKSRWHCRFCEERHNSYLHGSSILKGASEPQNTEQPVEATVNLNAVCSQGPPKVLLGTILLEIRDQKGYFQRVRAVLDSGSQHSFITVRCMNKLGLESRKFQRRISGIGQSIFDGAVGEVSCTLRPIHAEQPELQADAVVVRNICSFLPTRPVDMSIRDRFSTFQLADPKFWDPSAVQFLVGADLFCDIITGAPIQLEEGLPKLIPSVFGHIVVGKFDQSDRDETEVSLFSAITEEEDMSHLLSRFWEIEEVQPTPPTVSPEDLKCEEYFQNTHYRLPCGRYVVRLPFRDDQPTMGDSSNVAMKRFKNLERKLVNDSKLREIYNEFMMEYLALNHMEPTSGPSNFIIPHHGITKVDRNRVKLRVVFDGSVKLDNGSLNEALLVGPKLQKDIREILMNYRIHRYVFVADITKFYRQVLIDPADQPYQHIYYRFNSADPIQKFSLRTITYGLTSSPFLACRVMSQLLTDEGKNFPLASAALSRDIYVDDIATGASTVAGILELQTQVINLLRRGQFELSKWASNLPEILQNVPTGSSQESPNQSFNILPDTDQSLKILGMLWDPVNDCFSYSITEPELAHTKRLMLSTIARIYDPIGFLSPSIIVMKITIQNLWKLKLKWDQVVPKEIGETWRIFMGELKHLSSIKIPRFIGSTDPFEYQFIGFCDASNDAYCAVVFLRTVSGADIKVHLLTAKTKVAPVKRISIPRLELCAALLLAKLMNSLQEFKKMLPPTSMKNIYFSDSTTVLSWLRIPSYELKTFVGNRVAQILELTEFESWRHIFSEENAADCGSRGIFPSQLVSETLWWSGPRWLHQHEDLWPTSSIPNLKEVPEIRKKATALFISDATSIFVQWMSRVSCFGSLLRHVAWIKRLIRNLKSGNSDLGPIREHEMNEALMVCVKHVQEFHFFKGRDPKQVIPMFSQMSPFLDEEGVLRVGGRLKKANLNYAHKHPILLPVDAHFTRIMVDYYHRIWNHPGPNLLQALIQTRFWVPFLRRLVRKRLFFCNTCYKSKAKPHIPRMGDLPTYRLQGGRAFLHTGVDFAGPFTLRESLRRKAHLSKVYMCIFVCMSTKAVHLEAVTSLSTDSFLAALSRFTSRRGVPVAMYSDCGTNFVGAARVLGEFGTWFREQATQNALTQQATKVGFSWHFNPPHAPHFGGLWEAGVRSAKTHIVKTAGDTPMTYEEFATLLARVEAVMNSRPLCPLSNDPAENDYLSPGHFLIGGPILALPEPSLLDEQENRLSRWQLVSRMTAEIWMRWRRDYLSTLQKRTKWTEEKPNLEVNDLVLLRRINTPPLQWPLAKVTSVQPGDDGRVRVATVRVGDSEYSRPVADLAPLLPLKEDPHPEDQP